MLERVYLLCLCRVFKDFTVFFRLTVSGVLSFTEPRVADGEDTQASIHINNPDNETIHSIKLVDPAGNEHAVDENTLTHDIPSADINVHDGQWQLVIESGSAQPYDTHNSSADLDVFTTRKLLLMCAEWQL